MRVHVVKAEDSWVLKRIAESLQFPDRSISMLPDSSADVNLYINYLGMKKYVQGTVNVAFMTHLPNERDDDGFRRKRFFDRARMADHCIAQSQQTAKALADMRPPIYASVWGGAPDAAFVKEKLIIGIACKESRRKRLDRVEAIRNIPGIEVSITGGRMPYDDLVRWYRGLDYYVVTSDTEGGPYPVIEAIASGVPVIAPNVGWCWQYPCIQYDGSTEGLVDVLRRLRFSADPWKDSSAELLTILESLFMDKDRFSLYADCAPFSYFYHNHNCGLANGGRRTERTVELAVADRWLNRQLVASANNLVELGAVTPYYWPKRISRVYDPADNRASDKVSLFDKDLTGVDVLCLSTIEHIGEARYGLREKQTPRTAFDKIEREAGKFLISFPYGWVNNPLCEEFQRYVLANGDETFGGKGIRVFILTRQEDETWKSSSDLRPYGTPPKGWANTVIFLERGNLL